MTGSIARPTAARAGRKCSTGDIRSVTVDPSDDKVVYTGIEPVGLFRSEDGGDSWQEITALKSCRNPCAKTGGIRRRRTMAMCATFIFTRTIRNTIYFCLEHGGIVRSFDRGASLGRCQQRHRLSRHSCDREFSQTQRPLLRRQRARFFHQRQTGRRLDARRERHDSRLLSRLSFLAIRSATGESATMLIGDRRRLAGLLAQRKPRRARGDLQKHRRRAILDAHHQRPRRRSRLDGLGVGPSSDRSSARYSPVSAMSPAATHLVPAAPAI